MSDPRAEALRLVSEQAEDGGLWFVAHSASEAYLQQELRRLHAAVEALPTCCYDFLTWRYRCVVCYPEEQP